MTEPNPNPGPGAPPTAGNLLRAAREAMGMSLDTVAQQLKLAPRQVVALEENDFARLPGRTFVRGFLRNYARLVRVDPDKVLAALAGGDAASLDSPALQATAPTIGELPTTDHGRASWTRWGIPLTLVAVIAAAAIYEFTRGGDDSQRAPAVSPGVSESERGAAPRPAASSETPLPNPVGTPAPATGSSEAAGAPPAAATPLAASTSGDATLVLTYRGASWTEVTDGRRQTLVAQMIAGGQTRSITGVPPLDVVIGNAVQVRATLRGQPLDLVPLTQKGVARFVVE